MGSAAFYTHKRSITMRFSMTIHLASRTLKDSFVSSGWFYYYDLIENFAFDWKLVYFRIIFSRFQIHKNILSFFCFIRFYINNNPNFMIVFFNWYQQCRMEYEYSTLRLWNHLALICVIYYIFSFKIWNKQSVLFW